MIKTVVSIQRQINDRQYFFLAPYEASLAETRVIVADILAYVESRIEEAEKQQEKQEVAAAVEG